MDCCSSAQSQASVHRALSGMLDYLRGLEVTLGHPDWLSPMLQGLLAASILAFALSLVWRCRKNVWPRVRWHWPMA